MKVSSNCDGNVIFTGRNEVVAKVMFLLVSVILLTGGSASVHAGIPPPQSRHPPGADTPRSRHLPESRLPPEQTPQEQTPPTADTPHSRHPPADTPLSRHPQSRHSQSRHSPTPRAPPRADTPLEQTPPPPGADSGIQSMSGRYASYWNAFSFTNIFLYHCNVNTFTCCHETYFFLPLLSQFGREPIS